MPNIQINALVTRALLDDQFQADILNGQRRERLDEFELTSEERAELIGIAASNVDEFIRAVDDQIREQDWRCTIPTFERIGLTK